MQKVQNLNLHILDYQLQSETQIILGAQARGPLKPESGLGLKESQA